ncbi:ATP-binding protein [Streptomyces sp. SM12]|uniref:ATP-binding protein n=1 Tax=Streptomyces sp. SM12 TaxID=1071602 RepID=UPI000CD5395D|nr:ATP-binding protein [Streptomyces sp. SM12]
MTEPTGLVVLVGPAAAGKSAAASAWPPSRVVCLDELRARLTDDPGDQDATADAVAIQRLILDGRLRRDRPTLVDSTNVEVTVRADLLMLAQRYNRPATAVLFATPLETCLARNAKRTGSSRVPEDILRRQHGQLPTAAELTAEGFTAVITDHDGQLDEQ